MTDGGGFVRGLISQKNLAAVGKDFRASRERRLRSAAVTRLWRLHSNLISGLFGLEGISKRKGSHCRWAMRGLAQVNHVVGPAAAARSPGSAGGAQVAALVATPQ